MILFSIVVSIYNKKQYIERCLASLIDLQCDFDYEVILVDDGSTDGSEELCDKYAEEYEMVRVIHTVNRGVSSARNTGIKNARGEWVTLVDADDYLEEQSIKIMADIIKKHESIAEVIFYDGYSDKNGNSFKNECFMTENVDYSSTDLRRLLLLSAISIGHLPSGYRTAFSVGGVCCKLFKKEMLFNNGFAYDEDVFFAEDTLFSVRVLANARGIYYTPAFLYHYVSNVESVTRKYRKGLSKETDVFFEKLLKIEKEYERINLSEAIQLRSFIEAQRCLRNEFYNQLNTIPEKNKRVQVNEFLKKEPYAEAIAFYCKHGSIPEKMKAILLKREMYRIYMLMYRIVKG